MDDEGIKMTARPLFLMTNPEHFEVVYQINPWMQPDAWRADSAIRRTAAQASAALRRGLQSAGCDVESLTAVEGLPDLVFPANAAVVLDGRVLLARFRHSERQGEESVFRAAFIALKQRGVVSEVVELPPGAIQEGAGDCIWDPNRGFFWAGHGQRSTRDSLLVIEKTFGREVIALELATDRFYHLDTCFCPLAGGLVLYYPPAFTNATLATIRSRLRPEQRIEATDEEAAAMCVNAVNIGVYIVMAKAPESLRHKLLALGFTMIEIDLAPFILSGGGAYCMTLRLDWKSNCCVAMNAA